MNKIVTLEIIGKKSYSLFRKIPLVMRLSVVFFFLSLGIAVAGNTYAQNATLSLDMSNSTIASVLEAVENETDFSFIYDANIVNTSRKVSVKVDEKNIFDVLNKLFGDSDIAYTVVNTKIILNKKEAIMQQAGKTVTGVVTDKTGEPIIGANVLQKGTTNGTITDIDGKFTLTVPQNSVIVISYIGYNPQEVKYAGQSSLNVQLAEDTQNIEEVVVTALGIKKKEASLTYSTQQVGGDELTRAKDPNMINALAGKTAGVQINKSSSGLGGSAKVSIRGNRSVSGNNQPLYVIDGVPMLNSSNEQAVSAIGGTADAGNRDGGDGISNLNPDDIESMSILKGASAAALYGSQAANGVILITTKKGKAGVQKITFSSNLTVDHAMSLPEFQNEYGMDKETKTSWGPKGSLTPYDNVGDFFQNGVTAINSLSLTTGNEKMQTYFSYANTTAKGIVEHNKMQKHNLNFRETASFFDDYLKLDANVNLLSQSIKNRPASGGYYMNPLVGLYRFLRGENIGEYRTNFETFNDTRNLMEQNWYTDAERDMEQNPYWITNRIKSNDKRTRAITSLTASLKITDWLSLQARGTVDYTHDTYNQKMYASTAPAIAGSNGRYIDLNHTETLYYGDFMAMFNKKWDDFALTGAIGGSINSTTVNSLRLDSKTASLYYPNQFSVANIIMSTASYIDQQIDQKRVMQSVFATAQLGWKESLYLDLTARNDWSSTLAYTKHSSFFYPSVGLSWIINNSLTMPEWINFGKVRGSWSKVGNDLPLFISNPVAGSNDLIVAGGAIQTNSKAPFDELKPEMSTSWEVGTEWKFFDYRLDFDFTYYKTNTKNQLFTLPSSAGAAYKYYYVNAGNIQNQGVEISLGITPVMTEDFRWKTSFNFSTNKNKVIELHPDLKTFVYGDEGFSSSYSMRLVEGGALGDIYGKAFERDEATGQIVFSKDEDGDLVPNVVGSGNTVKVGNSNPDFMLGWGNTLTYKGFSLYFLIDGRFGGDVLSQTQADMDQKGVSVESAAARNAGFVDLEGTQVKPDKFYTAVSGRNGCTEYYMYSATNIRLRELSLGYTFPKRLLEKTKVFQDVQLSFVGRNLFFFHKSAPFDPDAVLSTGNDNQGIDVFGMPTTRSLGFNVKFTF
ncbi:TonB-dependent receptor [Parabacteroides goldsteinii]|uniref:TonB-dependent receptor n=1 Tax=Parabacteroides goldsteinii TaxID=328812 RepID=UPI003D6CED1D